MKLVRSNLEVEYYVDMITNNGFMIKKEDKFAPTNVDQLINSTKFMDCEYRCDCGAFIGQDILGQKCPRCHSEITLHSLNFEYTGWIDIAPHRVITPIYYNILKRAIGIAPLKFILGDYKADHAVKYNENDTSFEENQKSKKSGMIAANDIRHIIKKIPKTKHHYQGIGHDVFYERFDEILDAFTSKTNEEDIRLLKNEKNAVFTSKIPVYSTAFRPVSKTAETMFYPKINKWFSMIASIQCKLEDMILPIEMLSALNTIQNCWNDAVDHLIKNDISKKSGFIRSEIVGGTFCFSGRSVVTFDSSLKADEVDIPLAMFVKAYEYKIAHRLAVRYGKTLEQSYLQVKRYQNDPDVMAIVDELLAEEPWLFILREPTINYASIACMRVRRYKKNDYTISLPPEPLGGFNADFDGDALNCCFLPKEIVPTFYGFHYSCMIDYINEKITVSLREWNDISLGCITE